MANKNTFEISATRQILEQLSGIDKYQYQAILSSIRKGLRVEDETSIEAAIELASIGVDIGTNK